MTRLARCKTYPELTPAADEEGALGPVEATTPERVLGTLDAPVMTTTLEAGADAGALGAGADAGALLGITVTVE